DLNPRRQKARAELAAARFVGCPIDGGERGLDAALRQPQQREAGLRRSSGVAHLAIGVLGLSELAAQAMDLGPLIPRRAEGPRAVRRRGALGFAHGLAPPAAKDHDLRAVHA